MLELLVRPLTPNEQDKIGFRNLNFLIGQNGGKLHNLNFESPKLIGHQK